MKLIRVKTYEELSAIAADMVAEQIRNKPNSVLGLATGSSPIGLYDNLIQMHKDGKLDFSHITSVNLDEYIGLPAGHKESYRYFMNHHLFDHINIDKSKTFVPNGNAANVEQECKDYEANIKRLGGIDLQILGVGRNGHIGFNEPSDSFDSVTHRVTLDKSTIEANSRFFNSVSEVPTEAITMGIQTIMSAKKIILVANGAAKRDIIDAATKGIVTPRIPASILQTHPDATIIYAEK